MQAVKQLTAIKVQKLKMPGMYADGAGLYLQVTSANAKSWIFRYSLRGKAREMGLGSLRKTSLADARAEVADCHRLLKAYVDPIQERGRQRAAAVLSAAKSITFKDAARSYIASHGVGLKSPKQATQWMATIATYAEPTLGELLVRDIDTGLVHRVLEPIWFEKPETARRTRSRIEVILDWAKVHRYRDGENPAAWRGNLDKLLPRPSKVRKVQHHPALPHDELPRFMQVLRAEQGVAARALEFLILTAARKDAVLKATPSEISKQEKLWVVPASRMKTGLEHRVPLCARAMQLTEGGSKDFLFPGQHPAIPLSTMIMPRLLERIGYGHVTVHGFRSTFKDWARDRTRFDNYVVEAALSHATGDKIEAAYARSDVLDKRRKLMEAWAEFCASKPAAKDRTVVAIRGGRRASSSIGAA
jgi:integrase